MILNYVINSKAKHTKKINFTTFKNEILKQLSNVTMKKYIFAEKK